MLRSVDPVLWDFVNKESIRQSEHLELIASENFTTKTVCEVLGSCLTNKYSEGEVGKRYYGGNEYIDKIEQLCKDRALSLYRLSPDEWGVNVQPYSGSIANWIAYNAFLEPHDKIMGLNLPDGGHLTHGYKLNNGKCISATSKYFESKPYYTDDNGFIDYDKLEADAIDFAPKLIICGASAYPRDFDYIRFREIADKVGAYLLCDMAHISGLVATQEHNNPFDYCDIVTTTTHKTLRGPRSGMIFFKKIYEDQVNFSCFPNVQGGPHENNIGAVATCLLLASKPEFKEYIKTVKSNAKTLANSLINLGYKIQTGGTDNHLLLIDLKPHGINGGKIEKVLEFVNITVNKNTVKGDQKAFNPNGIRLGTAALTSRGMKEDEFIKIANFIDKAVKIALDIQKEDGKLLKRFIPAMQTSERLLLLKEEVRSFAIKYGMP